MKRDGWVREVNGLWILRFRYDWESWDQNPRVWIERGKLESNGAPLLKNRKRMNRGLAKKTREGIIVNRMETYCPPMGLIIKLIYF